MFGFGLASFFYIVRMYTFYDYRVQRTGLLLVNIVSRCCCCLLISTILALYLLQVFLKCILKSICDDFIIVQQRIFAFKQFVEQIVATMHLRQIIKQLQRCVIDDMWRKTEKLSGTKERSEEDEEDEEYR